MTASLQESSSAPGGAEAQGVAQRSHARSDADERSATAAQLRIGAARAPPTRLTSKDGMSLHWDDPSGYQLDGGGVAK